jgi:hypothetical protein
MFIINLLSLIFVLNFLFVFIYIHIVRKDLTFSKNVLSVYALGEKGYLVKLALILVGLSEIIIAINFLFNNNLFSATFMIFAGVGAIICGLFNTNIKKLTISESIHRIGAGMQFVFLPLAILSLFIFSEESLFFLIISIISLLFLPVVVNSYKRDRLGSYGFIEKLNIIFINICLVVFSIIFLLK